MNLFLSETESLNTLNKIRVTPLTKMKATSENAKEKDKIVICSTIEIEKYNNLWTNATFTITIDNKFTIEQIDSPDNFCIYLTNDLNSDKLIIASSQTQKQQNSNIFEIAKYMYNSIWVPIAKGELLVSESEWESLMPDVFKLYLDENDKDFTDKELAELEKKFDIVTDDTQLVGFLHAEFYMKQQPIMISYTELLDFCERYEI